MKGFSLLKGAYLSSSLGQQASRARVRRNRLHLLRLEDRTVPAADMLAVGTDAGVVAQVRVFVDRDDNGPYESPAPGTVAHPIAFTPFGSFSGGVRVAMGDFDGDGNDELVTAAGTGGGPHVIIWDMNPDGTVGGVRDSFLSFDATFFGGVFVAAGDLNGDLKDELVVSSDAGIATQVRIYSDLDGDGQLSDNVVDQFSPFPGFGGGARISVGNTSGLGRGELIVAAGPGGGPHVKIYTDSDGDRMVSDQALVEEFFAYTPGFTGGVWVTAGVLDYMATGAGGGGAPHVRIYRDSNQTGRVSDNPVFEEFLAYNAAFAGGVRVQGDIHNAGLVTAPGPGGGAHIKIFSDNGDSGPAISDNPLVDQFLASNDAAGCFLAVGRCWQTSYTRHEYQAIPDNGTLTSSLWVPAGAGTISELFVDLAIYHTYAVDLDVTLKHVPSGRNISLFTDVGGFRNGFIVRLDDLAATAISTVSGQGDTPIVGTYKPEAPATLGTFKGLDATGEWQLIVTDDVGGDTGTLASWAITARY